MVRVISGRDADTVAGRLRRLATGCCSWLVCCPPVLPADTRAERLADRLLPRSGWPEAAYVAVVVALLGLAGRLPARPGRDRAGQPGWGRVVCGEFLALSARALPDHRYRLARPRPSLLIGAGLGHSLLDGADRPAFLGVPAVGVLFEAATYLTRGSYTLAPTPDAHHNEAPSRARIKG